VGQALSANKYLSDDPLGVLDAIGFDELNGDLYIPDLSVGRLVETPEEITTTIATFISQDGVLDLSTMDATSGHKVLATGYDFLCRWRRWGGPDSRRQSGPRCDLGVAVGDGPRSLGGGDWPSTERPGNVGGQAGAAGDSRDGSRLGGELEAPPRDLTRREQGLPWAQEKIGLFAAERKHSLEGAGVAADRGPGYAC
jgi:hypothetical protein